MRIRMPASIHTHYPGHTSLLGTKRNMKLFLKRRPTGQIRGSNLRVKINGLADQGDPTRMKPVSHGSIGRWRVGSGQVNIPQSFRGSGQTRPDP